MKLEWVTVGDKSVCDDCAGRDGQQKTIDEWSAEGLPREGATLCGDNCRCMLLPVSLKDEADAALPSGWEGRGVEDIKAEVFEDLIGRIKFDKKFGKALLIDKFKNVVGVGEITYQQAAKFSAKFDRLMELVYRYQNNVGDLPAKYYELKNINQKIEFLEKLVENGS